MPSKTVSGLQHPRGRHSSQCFCERPFPNRSLSIHAAITLWVFNEIQNHGKRGSVTARNDRRQFIKDEPRQLPPLEQRAPVLPTRLSVRWSHCSIIAAQPTVSHSSRDTQLMDSIFLRMLGLPTLPTASPSSQPSGTRAGSAIPARKLRKPPSARPPRQPYAARSIMIAGGRRGNGASPTRPSFYSSLAELSGPSFSPPFSSMYSARSRITSGTRSGMPWTG